ncbi:MAG: response regulator [Clostridiales Family XIII bacterium]|nr:response regulator [Clostridiales Family XIII bacterium]
MKKLYPYLFSDTLPFDARLLNMLCFTGFVATALSMVGHLVEGSAWQIWALKVFMLASIVILFWAVNKYRLFKPGAWAILIVFTDIVFPLVFIWNGGFKSGISAYFVVTIVVIVVLSKGWARFIMMVVHFFVLGVCYYISWFHPAGIIIPLSPAQQIIDSIITFLIAGSLIGLVIVIMQRMYLIEQGRAEKASRAKGDFLAQMSHEMRTPMNAIIGMSAIAKNTDDPKRIKDSIEKIGVASEHLLGVINDILDMSKIEAGKLTLDSSDFDFYDMVERTVQVNNFRIEENKLRFILRVEKDIPHYLKGDSQRFAQVITNLLTNAVKFTPAGGTIKLIIRLIDEKDGVCKIETSVSDTGIGITEEQKERLFRSFEQADNTTSRKYGGTGLGLAIAKQIVELMKGDIGVESVPGEGSTFTFTALLPRAEAVKENKEKTLGNLTFRAIEKGCFEGHRILLAEDVEINREIVLSILEDTELAIDCALDGKQAVDMFAKNPTRYELIFMDIQMPEMDGYEATRTIRAIPIPEAATVPIIAMTANVFREDVQRSREAGMDGHIGKPLIHDEVITVLCKFLKPIGAERSDGSVCR